MIYIAELHNLEEGDAARPLQISESSPEIIKLVRLFSGTTQLVMSAEGQEDETFFAGQNYIRPDQEITSGNLNIVAQYIFDEVPGQEELVDILRRLRGKNHSFYRDLCGEFCLCLLSMGNNRFTEAFLFLYRSLERMSAACPLIYSSRQNDFRTAHKFLSGIYRDEKSPGELGLLQAFLKEHARDNQDFAEATLDIAVPNWGGSFASEFSRQWRDVVEREVPPASIDLDAGEIRCPYPNVASLIVTVRNRSFHNLSGQKNLDLFRLKGSDPIFSVLMPHFLQWTAYVFLDFARWQISSLRV
ncbi:MAG: hypothetical protein DI616_18520 [Paracoccus denitrificans]|uniref:Uncharacterized protein n=1 Tax=Paracoccus denitrificans TaxID=266 RepID=A0A533HXP4_PARDE|nr:MAG: hypothetical protein DI616_18520 [Paracoccus denitrificans]